MCKCFACQNQRLWKTNVLTHLLVNLHTCFNNRSHGIRCPRNEELLMHTILQMIRTWGIENIKSVVSEMPCRKEYVDNVFTNIFMPIEAVN